MNKKLRKLADNKLVAIFLACILIILIVNLFFNYFAGLKPIYTQTFFASVEVGNIMGFDVNGSALTFGMVMPGGSSVRKLNFTNEYEFPVLIEVIGKGDIAGFLSAGKVMVGKGEEKIISIGAYAQPNASYGVYSGNVSVMVFRCNKCLIK